MIILEEDDEFKIPDYDTEIGNVKALVEFCRKEIRSNRIQAIPHFNAILNRELDAVVDILSIGHFHAAARSARTALELVITNLYRHFYPGGRLEDISFQAKYGVRRLSDRKRSPILQLVRDGILWEDEFLMFREWYKTLSGYVHYRITYELCHTLPKRIKNEQYYAEVARLAEEEGGVAKVVKATLIKYSLEPALETLHILLKSYRRIR